MIFSPGGARDVRILATGGPAAGMESGDGKQMYEFIYLGRGAVARLRARR